MSYNFIFGDGAAYDLELTPWKRRQAALKIDKVIHESMRFRFFLDTLYYLVLFTSTWVYVEGT